jgi:hypothetical protein
VGWRLLALIHLNRQQSLLGVNSTATTIGQGKLGAMHAALINHPRLEDLPMIIRERQTRNDAETNPYGSEN